MSANYGAHSKGIKSRKVFTEGVFVVCFHSIWQLVDKQTVTFWINLYHLTLLKFLIKLQYNPFSLFL